MTALMDDALDAIPRQLSIAYKPTVQESLPKELKDLLLQFVASEMRIEDRALCPRRLWNSLWRSWQRILAPEVQPTIGTNPGKYKNEPHEEPRARLAAALKPKRLAADTAHGTGRIHAMIFNLRTRTNLRYLVDRQICC